MGKGFTAAPEASSCSMTTDVAPEDSWDRYGMVNARHGAGNMGLWRSLARVGHLQREQLGTGCGLQWLPDPLGHSCEGRDSLGLGSQLEFP